MRSLSDTSAFYGNRPTLRLTSRCSIAFYPKVVARDHESAPAHSARTNAHPFAQSSRVKRLTRRISTAKAAFSSLPGEAHVWLALTLCAGLSMVRSSIHSALDHSPSAPAAPCSAFARPKIATCTLFLGLNRSRGSSAIVRVDQRIKLTSSNWSGRPPHWALSQHQQSKDGTMSTPLSLKAGFRVHTSTTSISSRARTELGVRSSCWCLSTPAYTPANAG